MAETAARGFVNATESTGIPDTPHPASGEAVIRVDAEGSSSLGPDASLKMLCRLGRSCGGFSQDFDDGGETDLGGIRFRDGLILEYILIGSSHF